jgi:hypothetical protein
MAIAFLLLFGVCCRGCALSVDWEGGRIPPPPREDNSLEAPGYTDFKSILFPSLSDQTTTTTILGPRNRMTALILSLVLSSFAG